MVKYTVATTVAIVQLTMLAQTTVALPIEYAEGLESRAISNPNSQQLAEREDSGKLKERMTVVAYNPLAVDVGLVDLYKDWKDKHDNKGRRDLSDLYERDWDDYEKRNINDFEERDWNDFEERGRDDYELEARGLDIDELDELD